MSGYPPVSTGYDALAGVRHGQAMATAAFAAVNTSIPSDEEMIEDTPGFVNGPFLTEAASQDMLKAAVKAFREIGTV